MHATIRFGEFEIDPRRFHITRNGTPIPVGRRAYDLIVYLINHRDRVVPKEELLEQVWKQSALSDSAIARCVSEARKALDNAECIEVTYGRGYRWMIPVAESRADAPEHPSTGIFGRDRELGLVERQLRGIAAGRGGVCLVAGEAGIGKPRLLTAIRDAATLADSLGAPLN